MYDTKMINPTFDTHQMYVCDAVSATAANDTHIQSSIAFLWVSVVCSMIVPFRSTSSPTPCAGSPGTDWPMKRQTKGVCLFDATTMVRYGRNIFVL